MLPEDPPRCGRCGHDAEAHDPPPADAPLAYGPCAECDCEEYTPAQMTYGEAIAALDEVVPGWQAMGPEELRKAIGEHIDGLLDTVNALKETN